MTGVKVHQLGKLHESRFSRKCLQRRSTKKKTSKAAITYIRRQASLLCDTRDRLSNMSAVKAS